jgi:hypothetical protein
MRLHWPIYKTSLHAEKKREKEGTILAIDHGDTLHLTCRAAPPCCTASGNNLSHSAGQPSVHPGRTSATHRQCFSHSPPSQASTA